MVNFSLRQNPDGYNGQYYIQIQQLISTAGKRSKLGKLASTNAKLAELVAGMQCGHLAATAYRLFFVANNWSASADYMVDKWKKLNALLQGMKAQLDAGNIAQRTFFGYSRWLSPCNKTSQENNRAMEDAAADLRILL